MPQIRVILVAAKSTRSLTLAGRTLLERALAHAKAFSRSVSVTDKAPLSAKGQVLVIDSLAPLIDGRHWKLLMREAKLQKLLASSLDDGCGHDDCASGAAAWYFTQGFQGDPRDAFEALVKQGQAKALSIEGADTESAASPWGLDYLERAWRLRQVQRVRKAGAQVQDPDTTYIGEQVQVGKGSVIAPMTILSGATVIGKNCQIGPMARIKDSRVEDGAAVDQSILDSARVGQKAVIGPWARLRPGSVIGAKAKVGNFVEIKNSVLGADSRANHLSYLGDASVGAGANIGAGVITANYDGKNKHRTRVGKKAFIGSGTVLVAPVSVGNGALTGAGAVLLKGHNVPAKGVVAGVPARPLAKKKKPRG